MHMYTMNEKALFIDVRAYGEPQTHSEEEDQEKIFLHTMKDPLYIFLHN